MLHYHFHKADQGEERNCAKQAGRPGHAEDDEDLSGEVYSGRADIQPDPGRRQDFHRHGVRRAAIPRERADTLRRVAPAYVFLRRGASYLDARRRPAGFEKFGSNFRRSSFFIGKDAREAVNKGEANYIPIFLSQVPALLRRHTIPIDVALIQTSPPDEHGYMSLGISVDIVKEAVQLASLVIAQVNSNMPRVHGDSFVHIGQVDFLLPHDEPLLEYETDLPDETVRRMGKYVSNIVEDGDTIQVGYGSIPSAVISYLSTKHDFGRPHGAFDGRHGGPDAKRGRQQQA